MIEVRDTKSVPLTAQRVREAFEIANILPANFVPPDIEFVVLSDSSQFVGISLPLSLIPLRLQLRLSNASLCDRYGRLAPGHDS
jgi:hypothetical protein